jgi:glycosyltransferase involved in cell wall biosynthesis
MSDALECTVIVPTYKRPALLRLTLDSLSRQTVPARRFEVVVVDDEQSDGTRATVDDFGRRFNTRYLSLPDEGFWVSRARNAGIRAAAGKVCVFVDSGVILHSGCLAAHLRCHAEAAQPVAAIGYVYAYNTDGRDAEQILAAFDFDDPDATIEGFRQAGRWPDVREGFYARYTDDFADLPAPWLVYWTVNASARTAQLREIGMFDEAFRTWGGEDLDLGYRLCRAGARITLCREATALHLPHAKSFDDNMRSVATNYRYMESKYGGPVFELLATAPPEKFFELNAILLGRRPAVAP